MPKNNIFVFKIHHPCRPCQISVSNGQVSENRSRTPEFKQANYYPKIALINVYLSKTMFFLLLKLLLFPNWVKGRDYE